MTSDLSAMVGHRYAPDYEPGVTGMVSDLLSTRVVDLFDGAHISSLPIGVIVVLALAAFLALMRMSRHRQISGSHKMDATSSTRFLHRADAKTRQAAWRTTATELELHGVAGYLKPRPVAKGSVAERRS